MLTSVAVWSCSVSAPALFSSLLKNKAVTILCAVFFFFIVYLTLDYMKSCMHIIHSHFLLLRTVWQLQSGHEDE